ncbi:hypothetical protein [Marinifilum flexuosum]|nr:hypothetical protein [Marinifilum flexuosum]
MMGKWGSWYWNNYHLMKAKYFFEALSFNESMKDGTFALSLFNESMKGGTFTLSSFNESMKG